MACWTLPPALWPVSRHPPPRPTLQPLAQCTLPGATLLLRGDLDVAGTR